MAGRAAVAAAITTVAATAALPGPGPAQAAEPALTAEIVQVSVWSSGYGARGYVTNPATTPSTGWEVAFDLPAGTTITRSWSSIRDTDGNHHTFTDAGYNGEIPPGGTVEFGFNASGLGTPVNCTIDGNPCAGAGGDTDPPSRPAGLVALAVTAGSASLAWQPATDGPGGSGVAGYDVHRSGVLVASAAGTSVLVPDLAPGTGHTFTVTAWDAAGNRSTPSPPLTVPTPAGSGGPVVDVATAVGLADALATAQPGATIRLAPGGYHGRFVTERAGTAADPITLTGPPDAVLVNDGPSGTGPACPVPTAGWDSGYGLWLFDAPHWRLVGFTVADSKKGIVLDHSPHVTIDGVSVHHIQEEGVHFRRSSSDGVIRGSRITDTGLGQPGFGEAVYLGSARSNWDCHGNLGGADRSDRVQVRDNQLGPRVTAEHIDVKEGTADGLIAGNTFDGQGISGANFADSWVDLKGTGYLVEQNSGRFTEPGSLTDGYQTHHPSTSPAFPNGCGNLWRGNHSDLGGSGQYAIRVTSTSACPDRPNLVYTSNTVSGALVGLTNLTPIP